MLQGSVSRLADPLDGQSASSPGAEQPTPSPARLGAPPSPSPGLPPFGSSHLRLPCIAPQSTYDSAAMDDLEDELDLRFHKGLNPDVYYRCPTLEVI
jgi:hypothetical protein